MWRGQQGRGNVLVGGRAGVRWQRNGASPAPPASYHPPPLPPSHFHTQRAKLAFEKKLQEADNITHSIVRPTAFFKSLAAQVEVRRRQRRRRGRCAAPTPRPCPTHPQPPRHLPPPAACPAALQVVKQGAPYVMFGDGTLAACKPISERDLASFIADCVVQVRVPPCGVGGVGGRWGAGAQPVLIASWLGRRRCVARCDVPPLPPSPAPPPPFSPTR